MFLVIFKDETAGWNVHGTKIFLDYFALTTFFWSLYLEEVRNRMVIRGISIDRPHVPGDGQIPQDLEPCMANFMKWIKRYNNIRNTWHPFKIEDDGLKEITQDEIVLWASRR